jgi:hypothetical protein
MIAFIARVPFALYLFLFPAVGLLVGYIGFCDPDTCWHLALGKWMFVHGSLPHIDPFSSNIHDFVFVSKDLPLIQHEWLSDFAFYTIFANFGAIGLLLATAVLSICSFVILPATLMRIRRVPHIWAIACIALTLWASAFRLWVRPESFSFLSMSALILVNELSQTAKEKELVRYYVSIALIMVLWSNLHALFILGIAYLLIYFLLACFDSFFIRKSTAGIAQAAKILVAGIVGTLATPWNFAFWRYVGGLVLSPISHMNKENGALTLADVTHPTFAPLILLVLLFCGFCWAVRTRVKVQDLLFPIALVLFATMLFVLFRRMTPFALLILISAVAKIYSLPRADQSDWAHAKKDAVTKINPLEKLRNLYQATEIFLRERKIGSLSSNLFALVFCALSTIVAASFLVPPKIPSPSRLFKPPYAAIQYLNNRMPAGRLFNDSKFGSMMTWTMDHPPDLFIDGRFDSYDRQLVNDFEKMRLCRDNWRELLNKYKIGWIFFPPDAPIVSNLENLPEWSTIFADSEAVILTRSETKNASQQ